MLHLTEGQSPSTSARLLSRLPQSHGCSRKPNNLVSKTGRLVWKTLELFFFGGREMISRSRCVGSPRFGDGWYVRTVNYQNIDKKQGINVSSYGELEETAIFHGPKKFCKRDTFGNTFSSGILPTLLGLLSQTEQELVVHLDHLSKEGFKMVQVYYPSSNHHGSEKWVCLQ